MTGVIGNMSARTLASKGRRAWRGLVLALPLTLAATAIAAGPAAAMPEIRTSDRNGVPACVTPERLMSYLTQRNQRLLPQFRTIAHHYKAHGERYGVRWDYAFYQMLIETNFLTFRAPGGKWGDVKPGQNNFAGIGATGGGVPGDRYPDVSTGVLAQIQHLVAYSGEMVERPVAPRTREVQDKVVAQSRALGRPVTWRGLAGRWASDRGYGVTIASVAERYRAQFCDGAADEQIAAGPRTAPARRAQVAQAQPAPPPIAQTARTSRALPRGRALPADETLVVNDDEPARGTARAATARPPADVRTQYAAAGMAPQPQARPLAAASVPAERPRVCKVWTASYGGSRNVLIQTVVGEELHLTALQVLDGQEDELSQSFIESHAVGGSRLDGAFPNREAALVRAFDICPQAARLQR